MGEFSGNCSDGPHYRNFRTTLQLNPPKPLFSLATPWMLFKLNQTRLAAVTALFLAAFVVLAFSRFLFAGVNLHLNVWAASINLGFFLIPAQGISMAFDAAVLAVVSLTVAAVMLAKKHGCYSALLLAAMAGDLALVETCKILVASTRPTNEVAAAVGYSFPSGHVTGNVVFFGVIAYFAWVHLCSIKARLITASLYVAVIAVIGFNRIYLNVHWLTDVAGGVFLGAFWLTTCILIFKQTRRLA